MPDSNVLVAIDEELINQLRFILVELHNMNLAIERGFANLSDTVNLDLDRTTLDVGARLQDVNQTLTAGFNTLDRTLNRVDDTLDDITNKR